MILRNSASVVATSPTMPRVDADLKLDFKDVLFRPKRSSLKSRSEVGLEGAEEWGTGGWGLEVGDWG